MIQLLLLTIITSLKVTLNHVQSTKSWHGPAPTGNQGPRWGEGGGRLTIQKEALQPLYRSGRHLVGSNQHEVTPLIKVLIDMEQSLALLDEY